MKRLEFTFIKELTLDGWETEHLEPAIHQAVLSFDPIIYQALLSFDEDLSREDFLSVFDDYADYFYDTEFRRDTISGRAHQLFIDTFSKDEKDKLPGGYFEEPWGYRIPLMMFEYWQEGQQLKIMARCYYEEARPKFEHILSELVGEQKTNQEHQTEEVELSEGPWMQVPDEGHKQKIAKLWYEGKTSTKIADTLNISTSRFFSIKSELFNDFGEEVIPVRNPGAQKAILESRQIAANKDGKSAK